MTRLFTHQILDFTGDPLMAFQSKKEAVWFCQNKPDCKIIQVAKRPRKEKSSLPDWWDKTEECLF